MRFREIFRFEIHQRLRQASTWVYLALLAVLVILRADATDVGLLNYNAPVQVAGSAVIVGMLATLVTAGLFVDAGQRDVRWRMDPLFYTAPLRRRDYLGGRFAGALLLNALLLLVVPIGLLLSTRLPSVDPETLGPNRAAAYLLPYFVFLLPNLLVSAAVLFCVTVLTRRSLPGYLAALGLFVAYMFALGQSGGPGDSFTAALLDPTGAVALTAQADAWTRVELNTRLVVLQGVLLWNRLLWIVLTTGVLAFTFWRFRLAHAQPTSRRRRARQPDAEADTALGAVIGAGAVTIPAAPRSFGVGARVRQAMDVARMELRQTVLGRDFVLIAVGLLLFALMMIMEAALFGGALRWPLTDDVLTELTGGIVQTLIALLTVFYAGELVWRERDAVMEKIGDSTPVPDWVPFIGKLLALGLMLAVLQAVLMAAGMLGQALQGWYAFRPVLYLQALFGLQLSEYLLFAVLALVAHVLVNHKYVGHMAGVLLFVGMAQARRLGIEHNLLVYGSDPGWVYSDLNGFGPFVAPFVWFKLYWAAWALLLSALAVLFWVRGTEGGLRRRIQLARRRFTPRATAGLAAAALLVLATGGFVFYNTNVRSQYRTRWQAGEVHAEYERRYKRFEHAPQPWLTGTKLHVELYPERRRATVRGTYRLVNRGAVPIASVHLTSLPTPEISLGAIRFDRPARLVLRDAAHGYRIYALERPLQPGDSVRMHFELAVAPRGFRHREQPSSNVSMVGDFTHLGSGLLPAIGYQREHMELSAAGTRRAHGLPPSDIRPSIHDVQARQVPRISPHADWMDFEATIGTTREQFAVLPGALRRSWMQGGRRYFHYRTEAPILNFFSLVSARYAVREATWTPPPGSGQPVTIRVLHHPDHAFNVDRMIRSTQASLEYFTREFGPYPHRQLWLTEYPRYANFARAYGGHIIYSESLPMTRARIAPGTEKENDPQLMLLGHEVAHQWWGQQVMGADVQGSQMLSETLAQYSAAMMMKRTHGPEAARRLVMAMHERYLYGRGSGTPETPLMLTTDHAFLHYGKGAVVMYALQEYIGEERINTALRQLVREHGRRGPPYPTTLDLYRELQAVTPHSLRYLLDDLLATITLWDLRATGARAESTGGGAYRVTLEIAAAKLRSDSIGNDTPVPMNDLVEIGVFAEGEDGGLGKPLYLARHRIRSGRQTITVTVPGRPARAGIDPYHTLIARHVESLSTLAAQIATVEIDEPPG